MEYQSLVPHAPTIATAHRRGSWLAVPTGMATAARAAIAGGAEWGAQVDPHGRYLHVDGVPTECAGALRDAEMEFDGLVWERRDWA